MKNCTAIAFLLTACLPMWGCGSSHDLPLVPVSGRVTFDGGPCPGDGSITFSQISDSGNSAHPSRPGRARFQADGQFEVTSFAPGDGLLPGRYRVRITCIRGVPPLGQPIEDYSFVPSNYQPNELVVEEGQSAIYIEYDVPPKD